MAEAYLLKEAKLVNRGQVLEADLRIANGRIEQIGTSLNLKPNETEVACHGEYVLPGVIDYHVHFREPGLTHKGTISSESKAAIAGGVTSFMEMPNTKPLGVSGELLEEKYSIAGASSWCNYSFYIGATNTNLDAILALDYREVCGIKAFLGSSTGNMLMDDEHALDALFKEAPALVAIHAEDEATIQANEAKWASIPDNDLPADIHALIKTADACYLSSSAAIARAKRFGTRLHVLHITTARECALFEPGDFLSNQKQITAEACVHHLLFADEDYARLGNLIKCNPSIKSAQDREELWKAIGEGRLDAVTTDHAPHLLSEKHLGYRSAPAGIPFVQHGLLSMLRWVQEGKLALTDVVRLMAHTPAAMFQLTNRGFLEEGNWADVVLLENKPETVQTENVLYTCAWSPLEGQTYTWRPSHGQWAVFF
jgi:dihydroorotase